MSKVPSLAQLRKLARYKGILLHEGFTRYILATTDNPTTDIATINIGVKGKESDRQAKRILKGMLEAI